MLDKARGYYYFYQRWILLTGVVILIFILALGLFLLLDRGKKISSNQLSSAPNHPKTVITASPLQVSNVSPSNNAQNVGIYANIVITLSRSLDSNEQKNISVQTSPSANFKQQWSGRTLTLTPQGVLKTNTTYTNIVTYSGQPLSQWSFTVVSPNNISKEDMAKEQSQSDKNFGNWQQNIITNYPWYNKLPISTNSYFVYFDLNKKQIVARIYLDPNSSLSADDQIKQYQPTIESELQNIGVDLNKFPVQWTSVSS